MKLKEAIDIGRVFNCQTIADVDDLMYRFFEDFNLLSEAEMEEYWKDYSEWSMLYQSQFPELKFSEVKI